MQNTLEQAAQTRTLTVNTRNGPQTFTTTMDDDTALETLRCLIGAGTVRSSFGCDLLAKSFRGLSPAQMSWVHKIVVDAANPSPKPQPAPLGADMGGVVALFAKATSSRLKRPCITLDVGGLTIQLKMMTRGQHPGSIGVTDGGAYGASRWYGRIMPDGTFTGGRDLTDAVRVALVQLSTDPVGMASAHGHKTGRCCFCNLGLTDGRSVAVGYGATCAEHYGLPWGQVTCSPL